MKTSNSKPRIPQEKKKEDNKEIVDYFQKNDPKKKKVNETPNQNLLMADHNTNKVAFNLPNPYVKKIIPSPRANSKTKIHLNVTPDKISKEAIIEKVPSDNISNSSKLRDIMNKKRAELKILPQDEVVWIGKEIKKEGIDNKKEEKERKFPKIIIVEKPLNNKYIDKEDRNKTIDLTDVKNKYISQNPNPSSQIKKKEEEEFYDLNRYLDELNNLNLEEPVETNTNEQITTDVKSIDESSDHTRDYNPIEDESTNAVSEHPGALNDISSDNSKIEELRVELEKVLGVEIFKIVYRIVDEQV